MSGNQNAFLGIQSSLHLQQLNWASLAIVPSISEAALCHQKTLGWVSASCLPSGDISFIYDSAQDISPHKEAQPSLVRWVYLFLFWVPTIPTPFTASLLSWTLGSDLCLSPHQTELFKIKGCGLIHFYLHLGHWTYLINIYRFIQTNKQTNMPVIKKIQMKLK